MILISHKTADYRVRLLKQQEARLCITIQVISLITVEPVIYDTGTR